MRKSMAFTLAEVLVTLGIIGVVASLTMPTLVSDNKKKTASVRLEKYYSVMNQAFDRSYSERNLLPSDVRVQTGSDFADWFLKTGAGKFLQIARYEENNDELKVILNDGTAFFVKPDSNKVMKFTFCTEAKHCDANSVNGQNKFRFTWNNGKFVAGVVSDSSLSSMKTSCQTGNRAYCTNIIQANGWQIDDSYPWNWKELAQGGGAGMEVDPAENPSTLPSTNTETPDINVTVP